MREARGEEVCPVCGQGLPAGGRARRCPSCGARTLWQRPRGRADAAVVLFNSRLCGIIAGIQMAMMALLLSGYRIPLPWTLALGAASLPVIGYLVAGTLARWVRAESRRGYLVFLMSLNAGLLAALIAAVLGASGLGLLVVIALAAGVPCSRLISRILPEDGLH